MPRQRPDRKEFRYFYDMTSRWRDNDVYNHINNAVYYEYVDTAVNAWIMLEGGLDIPQGDIVGLVVNSSCDYFAPLSFPGRISAGVGVEHIGNSSVRYRVALFDADKGDAAAQARFTHVYVERSSHKPVEIPVGFRAALQELSLGA